MPSFDSGIFWDSFLDFEKRQENHQEIFEVLKRLWGVPHYKVAEYHQQFRAYATQHPPHEYIPAEVLDGFHNDIREASGEDTILTDEQFAQQMGQRVNTYLDEHTEKMLNQARERWEWEGKIRPEYFHVTEVPSERFVLWRGYLDYEQAIGDFDRIVALFERCLVITAQYEEFWLRYTGWMHMRLQDGDHPSDIDLAQDIRSAFRRASSTFVPIAKRAVRLQWALFEEAQGDAETALEIYQSILLLIEGDEETILAMVSCARRTSGVVAAIGIIRGHLEASTCSLATKARLFSEWARLLVTFQHNEAAARSVFEDNKHSYLDSKEFWDFYLEFEMKCCTAGQHESQPQVARVKAVFDQIRERSHLPREVVKEAADKYMAFLLDVGDSDAARMNLQVAFEFGTKGADIPRAEIS